MIIAMLLLAILSISAASASNNITEDALTINEPDENIEISNENESFEVAVDDAEYGTFSNLDYLISCSGNLTILNRDFSFNKTCDADFTGGIGINRNNLIIDGDNHVIDGCGLARMFDVGGQNITFKNINFINGYSADDGGIIYCTGSNLTIINCTFTNSHADVEGGALFAKSGNAQIIDSKFINNTAVYNAAIYMNGINSTVVRSYFESNVAEVSAGAIGWAKKDNGVVRDCIFVNNSALNEGGGAIFWNQGLNGMILNCWFESNYAIFNGSAIFLNSGDTFVSDSTFISNNASDLGGAIFVKGRNASIHNSKFINNSADVGGAIGVFYNVDIFNCTFAKNNARKEKDDVAIYVKINGVDVKDIVYGDIVKINVNVTRDYGIVSIVINNKDYSAEVINGTATIEISNLDAGKYECTVTYFGSVNCTNPKKDVQFSVNVQTPTITAKSASFLINYGGKYSVLLKDRFDKRLAGQKIKFVLKGRNIGSATTDKNGIATIKLTAKTLKTAKAGIRVLVIELVSKNYKKISKTANIKINKEKTKFTAKKASFKKSKKVKRYSVVLKNSKNKAVKKVVLTLKVKGKIYKAKTNAKGRAIFKITKLNKKGTFKALIKFKGNACYKAVKKSVKIKVK